ncbi:beta-galactosidase [Lentisphaerota bacterium WC36G]|nr:beta-galactosidase [Lentisphaerae bacterium WC36]
MKQNKKKKFKNLLFAAVSLGALVSSAQTVNLAPIPNSQGEKQPTFGIEKRNFVFNNKPALIMSGSLHYTRVPRAYWRDRMKKARAMGLNTISTYVFWNAHEKQPGQFDFTGELDIAEFCRIAQDEGLWVILRPGPYICSEWDLGGMPAWLLKDPKMVIRSKDPKFMAATKRYLNAVGEQLRDLQIDRGGPIIMTQVENEYAVFGKDKEYLNQMKQLYVEAGFTDSLLIRCDWPRKANIENGHIDGVTPSMNFGNNPQNAFKVFDKYCPKLPRMAGEFWTGWFDHWGAQHHSTNGKEKAVMIEWMLKNNISFNNYMFIGGTNFGFSSGANWSGKYSVDTTSYDYSANLHEDGTPAKKFYDFQNVIKKYLPEGTVLPPMPKPIKKITIPTFGMSQMASFSQLASSPVNVEVPTYMEAIDVNQGFVLYKTNITGPVKGKLTFSTLSDRAIIIVNGKKVGTLDRRHGNNQKSIEVDIPAGNATLDILVENMGHINFSHTMVTDRKGIPGKVLLANKELKNWQMIGFPLDNIDELKFSKVTKAQNAMPYFYKGIFTLNEIGDTFLDMRKWGKGMVWVNGHNLGRFWSIGPQQALYLPGCWLKRGNNEIIVMDLEPKNINKVQGLKNMVYELKNDSGIKYLRKAGQELKLQQSDIVAQGQFKNSAVGQTVAFNKGTKCRYICIEALSSFSKNDKYTTIAEVHMFDKDGAEIDRNGWKVIYADSEEKVGESGGADNIIDNQPVTYWHTKWQGGNTPTHPHQIVIDLGKKQDVGKLLYLPRANKATGRIKDFKIYGSNQNFIINKE